MDAFRITPDLAGGTALSGTEAIDLTVQVPFTYRLAEARLTLGAVSADLGDLSITLDSELGAGFDNVISTPDPDEDLAATTSFRYADIVPPIIFPGDAIKIAWPNVGGKAWALDIIGVR